MNMYICALFVPVFKKKGLKSLKIVYIIQKWFT